MTLGTPAISASQHPTSGGAPPTGPARSIVPGRAHPPPHRRHERQTRTMTTTARTPHEAPRTPPQEYEGWPLEAPRLPEGADRAVELSPLLAEVVAGAPWTDADSMSDRVAGIIATTTVGALGGLLRRLRDRYAEREWGMSSSRVELLMLLARSGSPTMSELARTLDVTPRAVTRLVDGLEADGYVVRERQADDARVIRVRCTPEVLDRVARAAQAHLSQLLALCEGVDGDDLRTTVRVLQRISARARTELGLT